MFLIIFLFAKGFLFSLSLCCDIGIVNLAIIKTGVEKGFRRSLAVGLGSCFGDLTYLALSLIGLSYLLEIEAVRWLLWLGGTIVLLWLTVSMVRKSLRPAELGVVRAESAAGRPMHREFWTGLGLALSSPTSILWFAAVAGPIIGSLDVSGAAELTCFAAGFFIGGIVWSAGLAALSGIAGRQSGASFVRAVSVCSAVLFLYFAFRVFLEGYDSFITGAG